MLTLPLTVLGYALVMGLFDRLVSTSDLWVHIGRRSAYVAFVGGFLFLSVRAIRCAFRPVNPYYVAHQLEGTLPDAKNSLINWLDLHDEGLPSAFQKNLSARAAEQWKDGDIDQTVTKRKNWILLGVLALPVVGLIVLAFLGSTAFMASMQRAFVPFNAPAPAARTKITVVQPEAGDAEVGPTQAITIAAKIDGRVPIGNRPDAPKLLYRYQDNEDYFSQPLQFDGSLWTTQLHPPQIRTGFSYKITAGDAETAEYQVRLRTCAHARKFEVTYLHRAYRKLPKATIVFPNEQATKPFIHGPRGSEVELVVRANRPVAKVAVEIVTKASKENLPTRKLPDDPHAFRCRWTLDQPGEFRVLFTTTDGDENADREAYRFDVLDDEAPKVVLTQPGKDIALPVNGTLEIAGEASSALGLKSLTLHLRIIEGEPKLMPKPYRPGKSFQFEDGNFPTAIGYKDFVALDQFKNEKGTLTHLREGDVLEYWLEGADCSDHPSPAGNVGKSIAYKVKLLPATKDSAKEQAKRKQAEDKQAKHEKKQDDQLSKENKSPKKDPGGSKNPDESMNDAKNDIDKTQQQLDKAKKEQDEQKDKGGAKDANPKPGDSKDGPQESGDGPKSEPKGKPSMPPDDAGNSKDQGGGQGTSGQAKDGGAPEKKGESAQPSSAKGIEQNGPESPNKDKQTAMKPMQPPEGKNKGDGKSEPGTNPGEPKQGPPDSAAQPGQARGEQPKANPKERGLADVARAIEQFSDRDGGADKAAAELVEIAKNSDDPRARDLAKEVLEKNGRDPKNGQEKKKVPNPAGTLGKSQGISDDVKTAAANREFAARIGQMQLDDWKKRLTPDLLKKAGLSDEDWQRYMKSVQSYDALVRQLNAKLAQKALKDMNAPRIGSGIRVIEGGKTSDDPLNVGPTPAPPDLRDAQDRFIRPR